MHFNSMLNLLRSPSTWCNLSAAAQKMSQSGQHYKTDLKVSIFDFKILLETQILMKKSEPFIYSLPVIQNYSFKMLRSKDCVLLLIEIQTEFFFSSYMTWTHNTSKSHLCTNSFGHTFH